MRKPKIGDIVSIHPTSEYFECTSKLNPSFIRGEIFSVPEDLEEDPWMYVKWDNGTFNTYCTEDLLLNPRMPAFSKPKGMGKGTTATQIIESMMDHMCTKITGISSNIPASAYMEMDLRVVNKFERLQRGPQYEAILCASVGCRPSGKYRDA